MNILVIGSGGREHAIVDSLCSEVSKSDGTKINEVFCSPGNPGIEKSGAKLIKNLSTNQAVCDFCSKNKIELVVIGPEKALVDGLADALKKSNIPCFGPTANAAKIESSKEFAKNIMEKAGVPTGKFLSFNNAEKAKEALGIFPGPFVVKQDGLASGKGVVVTTNKNIAKQHIDYIISNNSEVIIEEFLQGPEISLFCVCDGNTVVPLQPAQDYKRVGNGNTGANTGGMGAYSPLNWIDNYKITVDSMVNEVAKPVVEQMKKDGNPFVGLLYCGLIATKNGIKVIEFNARFGDPETQVVLPLLKSNLSTLLYNASAGSLELQKPLKWEQSYAVNIVIASKPYPNDPIKGEKITGICDALSQANQNEKVMVFHAGTKLNERNEIVSNGGRVLNIVGFGKTMQEAKKIAYKAAKKIHFENAFYRTDIAKDI